jgi:hypothetical protein
MHNTALNQLRTKVASMDIAAPLAFRAAVNDLIDKAIDGIEGNGYVDDCLFQIEDALTRLSSQPEKGPHIRDYLLGAIEALRDELRLCEMEAQSQPKAVGF